MKLAAPSQQARTSTTDNITNMDSQAWAP